MHLYYLAGPIPVFHLAQTYNNQTSECIYQDESLASTFKRKALVPQDDNAIMFVFPYKDLGKRVDGADNNLLDFW